MPLIEYAARTGKPMIISTGMADEEENLEAFEAAKGAGCKELATLHCVSGYPAPVEDDNLRKIPDMIERFGQLTGLSDYTIDSTTAVTSVARGASLIEKHFTLDLNGENLLAICHDTKAAWQALGEVMAAHSVRSVRPGYGLPPKFKTIVVSSSMTTDVKKNSPVTEDCFRGVTS